MAIIKRLSEVTINKIAAGEVVERPASALKEIVENAIDAGSNNIEITLEESGKNLILVSDDGSGMEKDDLEIAIERHTTSKLDESDIMRIENFGFRGEALPSIASISRLFITSSKDGINAHKMNIEGGQKQNIQKSIRSKGTTVEIRDLFFATPARLKFLRSDKQELNSCKEIIKKIAMSHPNIAFKLTSNGKELLNYKNKNDIKDRILEILGEDFINNSSEVSFSNNDINIQGMVSLPTYHKGTSEDQYLFINNRPVKDKLLLVAVKVAYQDFIEKGRHPIVVLFLNTDPRNVDVNVHPAKTEVRFHDPNFVRQSIISSIKEALHKSDNRVSDTLSKKLNNILSASLNNYQNPNNNPQTLKDIQNSNYVNKRKNLFELSGVFQAPSINRHEIKEDIHYHNEDLNDRNLVKQNNEEQSKNSGLSMGSAICQINKTYIISQTENAVLIVDQHAAHERLVYEELKEQIKNEKILRQRLLIPEIIDFHDEKNLNLLEDNKEELSKLGLVFEKFSNNSIIIREIPRLISEINIKKLIQDIIDELSEFEDTQNIIKLEEHIIETYACHHSIRAGRSLNIEEMNQLLRQMENTPFSGQCNHGRPTYVKLQIKDIEKLLGR